MPRSLRPARRLHELRQQRARLPRRGRKSRAAAPGERGGHCSRGPADRGERAGTPAGAAARRRPREVGQRGGAAAGAGGRGRRRPADRCAGLGLGLLAVPAAPRHRRRSISASGGEGEQRGVYHSAYDSYDHYERFGDPGYAYGVALAKVAGRTGAAPCRCGRAATPLCRSGRHRRDATSRNCASWPTACAPAAWSAMRWWRPTPSGSRRIRATPTSPRRRRARCRISILRSSTTRWCA